MNELYLKGMTTTINTKLNNKLRVSSAYRRFSNGEFTHWQWDTVLWEYNTVKEAYGCCSNTDDVIKLHCEIFEKHINEKL